MAPGRSRQIVMPDGTLIWARVECGPDGVEDGLGGDMGVDVGIRDVSKRVVRLLNFTETIKSVAASVHEGVANLAPTTVSVEFSIEISVQAGQVVSVLADAGSKASVTVRLDWERGGADAGGRRGPEASAVFQGPGEPAGLVGSAESAVDPPAAAPGPPAEGKAG
jgi:Trypsin-co-occurring domain 1